MDERSANPDIAQVRSRCRELGEILADEANPHADIEDARRKLLAAEAAILAALRPIKHEP